MSYDDPVDLTHADEPPSVSPIWRKRAVELAAERKLIGQVMRDDPPRSIAPEVRYRCVNAQAPIDHLLYYYPANDAIVCDCEAGVYGRPCSHAGATLLLVKGLAPERTRDPEGFSHGAPTSAH